MNVDIPNLTGVPNPLDTATYEGTEDVDEPQAKVQKTVVGDVATATEEVKDKIRDVVRRFDLTAEDYRDRFPNASNEDINRRLLANQRIQSVRSLEVANDLLDSKTSELDEERKDANAPKTGDVIVPQTKKVNHSQNLQTYLKQQSYQTGLISYRKLRLKMNL